MSASTESYYFAGGDIIHLAETTNPLTRTHRPMLEMKFENNGSDFYLSETFNASAQFQRNENDVLSAAGLLATQQRDATAIDLNNHLWGTIRKGQRKTSFTSDIRFTRAPRVLMTMNDIRQSGQSSQLNTRHRTNLQIRLGSEWKIDMPIELTANYNCVQTALLKPGLEEQAQRVSGWKVVPMVGPTTSWTSRSKRLHASMGIDLRWLNLSYLSHYDDKRTTLINLFAEPRLSVRYTFSGTSELTLNSGFHHSAGDIMDLLTTAVQTDYRNTSAASGVIAKSQSWNTTLRYIKQVPFSYFNFSANASYNQGKRNVLSSRMVSPTSTESMAIFSDSHTRSAQGGAGVSKNILQLATKLTADARIAWSSSEHLLQNEFVTSRHTGYGLNGRADITPLSWLEVNVNANYGKAFSRTRGERQSSDNFRCSGSVAVFPISAVEVRGSYHFMRNMVEAGKRKNASMLSASVQYKAKRAVWKLTGENLLDVRQYTLTSFVDSDRFVHTTHLVGRTLMLTCKLLLTDKSKK